MEAIAISLDFISVDITSCPKGEGMCFTVDEVCRSRPMGWSKGNAHMQNHVPGNPRNQKQPETAGCFWKKKQPLVMISIAVFWFFGFPGRYVTTIPTLPTLAETHLISSTCPNRTVLPSSLQRTESALIFRTYRAKDPRIPAELFLETRALSSRAVESSTDLVLFPPPSVP